MIERSSTVDMTDTVDSHFFSFSVLRAHQVTHFKISVFAYSALKKIRNTVERSNGEMSDTIISPEIQIFPRQESPQFLSEEKTIRCRHRS